MYRLLILLLLPFFLLHFCFIIIFLYSVLLSHWASERNVFICRYRWLVDNALCSILITVDGGCLYILRCARTHSFHSSVFEWLYYCYYDFTVFHCRWLDGMRNEACGMNKYSSTRQYRSSRCLQCSSAHPLKRTEHYYQYHTKYKCLNCDVVAVIRIGSIVLMLLLL